MTNPEMIKKAITAPIPLNITPQAMAIIFSTRGKDPVANA